MIKEAMQYIHEQAKKTRLEKINEFRYSIVDGEMPIRIASPLNQTIKVQSLEGLARAYEKALQDDGQPVFINVRSPHVVQVLLEATVETDLTYPVLAEANCSKFAEVTPVCGRYMKQEEFVILAYAHFYEVGDWADVMRTAGNLRGENVMVDTDDGVTQVAQVQRGAKLQAAAIKNPVMLASRLTFPEVEPQAAPYILRVKTDGEPAVSLFEVHGGSWERSVRKAIAEWLALRLTKHTPTILL